LNLQIQFWLRGWKKCEVYKRKVGTREELFARILDAAASIKKRVDRLRRTTRDFRTRAANCTEIDRMGVPNIYSELSKICNFCVQICRLNKLKLR